MSTGGATQFVTDPTAIPVVRLALAAALGLFLGLEREWSEKSAGIRTFSLTSLVGAVFTLLATDATVGAWLLAVGGLLVIVQGTLLAVRGLQTGDGNSLSLTTSMSLLAAYGVGALVAAGYVLEGVTVAVLSSALLVLKRELHTFAGDLSRTELRSMTEFAVLAFVVYPLLPAGERTVLGVPLEPRVAWLMVVTVAGIGIANYALVRTYGGRGVAVTGFFGGLASSTAVVGTMLDHASDRAEAVSYAVAGVLLANAAMALRNLGIAVAFTVGGGAPVLGAVVAPLTALAIGAIAVAAVTADWREPVPVEIESPFSLRNALAFGAVFLLILAGSTLAEGQFGTAGLYASAVVSGLVSSAGATTSAVLLYRGGTVTAAEAALAVMLATGSSVAVKTGLALAGPRAFRRRVVAWSIALLGVSGAVAVAAAML
ncbi:MgtC/SapB family protein [Halobaculum sp. CBA1158]|uniref:MgtC/SapB family protein n=1 Tax=Halobaculum sp. CBA1158 TaxID=2904243 RepID=UPI001F346FD9|nr:MgtC/SapB family protein [Halobaculum sp. CBA1158]UIO99487.1 MgtC/SapB family protein [Halobaculum sp. CBA1158]